MSQGTSGFPACDVDRTRLHHLFGSCPPLYVFCLFPRLPFSSVIRQAFQLVMKYILTTIGAAKMKRYYEHIFGVTAIFRASFQSRKKIFALIVHGVRNPMGLNIFNDNFKTECFVAASNFP